MAFKKQFLRKGNTVSEKRLRYAKLQKDRSEIKWHVLGRDESKLVVIWSKLASEEKRVPGFVMV